MDDKDANLICKSKENQSRNEASRDIANKDNPEQDCVSDIIDTVVINIVTEINNSIQDSSHSIDFPIAKTSSDSIENLSDKFLFALKIFLFK